ncbi:hypothetical protein ScPMuIL_008943 [Solemya velum]
MTVDGSLMDQDWQEKARFAAVSVENMTQDQLRELIPGLVQMLSKGTNMKPDWWPDNLSWSCTENDNSLKDPSHTEVMRNVVRKCYQQFGQDELLSMRHNFQELHFIKSPSRGMVLQEVNKVPSKYNSPNTQCKNDPRLILNSASRAEPVWICIMCAKAFSDQDTLTKHQDTCDDDIETKPSVSVVAPLKRILRRPKRKRKFFMSEYNFPSEDVYFTSLGLAPPPKVKKMISSLNPVQSENSKMTLKDFEEPCSPVMSPHTPKYKSQRSQEGQPGSACKRKFSFSSPTHHNESDESSQDEEDETETVHGVSLRNSLLCIDFSSDLGKKFNKYMKPANCLPAIPSYETYCNTVMKNEFLEKLRYRSSDYPITFKGKKKYLNSHFHEMRFGAADRREFLRIQKTGLNKKSRWLKRNLSKCRVILDRLTKEEIYECCRPKPKPIRQAFHYPQMIVIDDESDSVPQPVMLFQHGGGAMMQDFRFQCPPRNPGMPSVSRIPQNYPLLQRQLLANPARQINRPQFLVKKLDKRFDGQESQRFVYVPVSHRDTGDGVTQQGITEHTDRRDPTSQRRKQNFEKIRDDDEICIVCMSSDEEDNDCTSAEKLINSNKSQVPLKSILPTKPYNITSSNKIGTKITPRERPGILTAQSQQARSNFAIRNGRNQQALANMNSNTSHSALNTPLENHQRTQQNTPLENLRAQLECKRNFNAQLAQARSNALPANPMVRPNVNNSSTVNSTIGTITQGDGTQLMITAVYSLGEDDCSDIVNKVLSGGRANYAAHSTPVPLATTSSTTVVATVNDYTMEKCKGQQPSKNSPSNHLSSIQKGTEAVEVICIDDDDD